MGTKFNPFTGTFDYDSAGTAAIPLAEKGAVNGVATLDGGGKVPSSQLPASIMTYEGVWNATTNSPTLSDASGDIGMVYRVSVAGTQNLGSGAISYNIGDYVILNSSLIWEKSDTTDAVVSVNSLTGIVTIGTDEVAEGITNLYFTDFRAKSAAVSDTISNGIVDVAPSQNAVFDALTLKEDLSNKATDLTTPDNTKYPTTLATTNALDLKANTDLSNLANPTSINRDLIFNKFDAIVQTQDSSSNSSSLFIKTGTAVVAGSSGDLNLYTGDGETDSGSIILITGTPTTNNRGRILLSGSYISVDNSQITDVLDPILLQDAATKNYVDSQNTNTNTNLTTHINNTTGAHTASAISNTPAGNIVAINVQNAINELDSEKQAVITGAATTIVSSNLTASRALASDVSGKVVISSVTDTELNYVSGVTSSIQTQLSNKEPAFATLPISKGGTNSGVALNNNRIIVSSTGSIVESAVITASRALASNSSGIPVAATTTAAELDFVSGVTSSIQTQLNGKQASGSFANQDLANLTTTAINSDLIFNKATAVVKTQDSSAAATNDVALKTGDVSTVTNTSGAISVQTGASDAASATATGAITVSSGARTAASSTGSSGAVNINTGTATAAISTATSGSISMVTGGATGGATGNISIITGAKSGTQTANTGALTLSTGASSSSSNLATGATTLSTGAKSGSGAGTSGAVLITSGNNSSTTAPTNATGTLTIQSGDHTSATASQSGAVLIKSGIASGANSSGTLDIATGAAASNASGNITVKTGAAQGTGTIIVSSGNASAGNSGSVSIIPGTATATAGAVVLTGGASGTGAGGAVNITGGTSSSTTSGAVLILSGSGGASRASGTINIFSGQTSDVASGNLRFESGGTFAAGLGGTGTVTVGSGGNVSTSTAASGATIVKSGNSAAASAASGTVTVNSGAATGTANASGPVQVLTGASTNADSGTLFIGTGTGGTTTGNVTILSGNAAGGASGNINITSGTASTTRGNLIIDVNKITVPTTVTAGGTTGAQTINNVSGTVNFAATDISLVVTNNIVTANSLVFVVIRTNDSTATIKNVVPASGSFTINLTAAATAETSVGFFIVN